MQTPLRSRTHLLCLVGSRAHGTHHDESDIDVAGVSTPMLSDLHGLHEVPEQVNDVQSLQVFADWLSAEEQVVARRTQLEGTVFDLRKCLRLAIAANPNMLELLCCRDQEVRRATDIGERLRQSACLFITERCRQTFGGYAAGQLDRIQRHHRWHHDGPKRGPTREDFGLPVDLLVPREQLQAVEAAIRKQLASWELDLPELSQSERLTIREQVVAMLAERQLASSDDTWQHAARWIGLDDNFIEVMARERQWRSARAEWKRYNAWLKNRNPARAKLEAEFGYDTKHGAHLVRLLRMGIEAVTTGQVSVWRGDIDADELKAIRRGAWSYEQLQEWTSEQRQVLAKAVSVLPKAPDRERVNTLCIELIESSATMAGSAQGV